MSVYESLDEQKKFACRVIADHARATAFSIADGILPGNEGRNYVLRKIMRRAIYQGRQALGFHGLFFHKVANFVVDQMKEAYPELETHRDFIEKMVRLEEERFGATLTVGLNKLEELIRVSKGKWTIGMPDRVEVSIRQLARLYDTFGTPIDLMYVILSQRDLEIIDERTLRAGHIRFFEEEAFRRFLEDALKEFQQSNPQKQTAENEITKPIYVALVRRTNTKSEFKGYETTRVDDSQVVALINGNDEVQ